MIQSLMEHFHKLTRIPMAIIDMQGRVLVGVGWQDICTKFHRVHLETRRYCQESDLTLTADIQPGQCQLYKCRNNMWDMATPIVVGGQRMGHVFTGQFFFENEPIDRDVFLSQARRYGFDEGDYVAALDAVPRFPRHTVDTAMAFFMQLAQVLSQLSCSNVKLARLLAERDALTGSLRASEEQLRAAAATAEQANRAKDQFLAVLSHELRTPLNPALMAATILGRDAQLPPDLREDVEMIRRNIELEARLIDDLLDLTRIARGKVTLARRTVDAREVLRHAIETCQADAHEKRLDLQVSLPPEPIYVNADPARLQQVFWNVLKNAVKFTPESGRITVVASAAEHAGLRVEITDTGKGIEPDAIPRIFDAFEQGGAGVTKRYGGLGLGLAICKGLISMHDGSIQARSDGPGKGATFIIELPPPAPAR